ncbi:MarR family winged helix-turn-helix transcriptional regulator [Cohnella fermenti]|uniref:MarR family transcriptional regulator n=1 Tax=Cohnella fermenti TaxID=2565925 RepID=A0A4S4C851_9BACL|nr:MarR family transcriptional regulator [Cohnella fermenti]THF84124.1 MarR family transcriptional regulator [Cohnella fermenti]
MNLHDNIVELFGLIRQHNRTWRNEWAKDIESDLSISQVQALDILQAEGARPSSYLSNILGVTSGGMTVISDKLVKQQLVERVNDPNDRRVVKLEITDLGKHTLASIQDKRVALMEKMFSSLSEDDIHRMLNIYRKLLPTRE